MHQIREEGGLGGRVGFLGGNTCTCPVGWLSIQDVNFLLNGVSDLNEEGERLTFATTIMNSLFRFLLLFLEALPLREAAQVPMLTLNHCIPRLLRKDVVLDGTICCKFCCGHSVT